VWQTITAAFEMDEILYALRDHSLGLNCGRYVLTTTRLGIRPAPAGLRKAFHGWSKTPGLF
jgi:hypothetical protein